MGRLGYERVFLNSLLFSSKGVVNRNNHSPLDFVDCLIDIS